MAADKLEDHIAIHVKEDPEQAILRLGWVCLGQHGQQASQGGEIYFACSGGSIFVSINKIASQSEINFSSKPEKVEYG